MERRRAARFKRRLPVTLWVPGKESMRQTGYTTNLSLGGVFVHANRSLPARTRVRVEIGEGASSLLFEAVVVKEHEVPHALRVVNTPGMGLRFLHTRELLRAVVPNIAEPEAPAPAAPPVAPAQEELPTVDLSSAVRFADAWKRDLRAGGVFVQSTAPATLHKLITIGVKLPDTIMPLRIAARVVMVGKGGYAVEFVDKTAARAQFALVADRLGVA